MAAAGVAWLVESQMPWRVRDVVASAGPAGSLHVKRAGKGPWVGLSPGALLRAGDRVGTAPKPGEAVGDLRLASGVCVKLNAGTLLELLDEDRVYMYTGEVYVAARPGGRGFSIQTSSATVDVRGTRFTVLATKGSTRVTVIEGSVSLANRRGEVSVGPAQAASADKGAAPRAPVQVDPAKAIGWMLRSAPKISLSLSAKRISAGRPLVAQLTVTNPRREAIEIYAPGGAQPFYMFRITESTRGDSWVIQASPPPTQDAGAEGQAATVNIAPGGRHSFKCSPGQLTARPGEYSVSVIY